MYVFIYLYTHCNNKIDPLGDMTVPVHGDARGLDSVLIEVRNDLLRSPQAVALWAERLAPLL